MTKIGASRYEDWNWRTGLLLTNPKDSSGNYQVHVQSLDGSTDTCLTCTAHPGAPPTDRYKVFPRWSPDGKWVLMSAEMPDDPIRRLPRLTINAVAAILNGYYSNLYVTTPDGSRWYKLTDYTSQGLTGTLAPFFTRDGSKVVWSKLIAKPDSAHPFATWQFWEGDFVVDAQGTPSLQNVRDITPQANKIYEVSDASPDRTSVLFMSDIGAAEPLGLDIFRFDLKTRTLTNLTNTPDQYDEHAVYSPSGKKIAWMSSMPYASQGPAARGTLRTELMLMNADGSDKQQLTHFGQPGYAESTAERSIVGRSLWSADGTKILVNQLLSGPHYPDVVEWLLTFQGKCG